MAETFDIAIVGAGITGCAIARQLARFDLSICVVEAANDIALGASKANGGLVDAGSVLEALKTGKVSAFAMDVYEGEDDFVRLDFDGRAMEDPVLEELLNREDVIYTAHVSFLTDQALYEIMRISLENASEYEKNGCCQNEVADGAEGK